MSLRQFEEAAPVRGQVTPSMPILRSQNFVSIQILRALAALMVVIWHSHLSVKKFSNSYLPTDDRDFLRAHCPSVFNHLYFGVDIFFCISGFIMCMLVLRGGEDRPSVFILRRVTRIFPMYWLFTAIVVMVCVINPQFNVAGFSGDFISDLRHVVLSSLLIPEGHAPVLGVGWTLVQEMLFYICISLLLIAGGARYIVFWIFGFSLTCLFAYSEGLRIMRGQVLSIFFVEFLFGALAYRYHQRVSGVAPAMQIFAAAVLYVALSIVSDRWNDEEVSLLRVFGCGIVGFLLISGSIGFENKLRDRLPVVSLAKSIGDSSYVLYLSHWLVLSLLGKLGGLVAPNLSVAGIAAWHGGAVISAVIAGWLIHVWIEKPTNIWLRKKLPLIHRASSAKTLGSPMASLEKLPS